jgi:uncharacterized protein YutE (UPF0331/DUF86 family)
MTPSKIRAKTVTDAIGRVRSMVEGIRTLPMSNPAAFTDDPIVAAAAESFLRRALEALIDLGRHVLAKGFGRGVPEYKKVAIELGNAGVLDPAMVELLAKMAGYRNRLVHFYDEVTPEELFLVCSQQLGDIEAVVDAVLKWLRDHPEILDSEI